MAAALEHARTLGQAHSMAFVKLLRISMHFWLDEPEEVIAGLEEYLDDCREQAFTYFYLLGSLNEGWARFRLEPSAAHADMIERHLQGWSRIGASLAYVQHSAALVEARIALGHLDAAAAYLAQGREKLAATGEHVYSPVLPYLEGRLALAQSPPNEARAADCYREALAMADAMQAAWHTLRPTLGWAQLLRRQHRIAEARELLARNLARVEALPQNPLIRQMLALDAELQDLIHHPLESPNPSAST